LEADWQKSTSSPSTAYTFTLGKMLGKVFAWNILFIFWPFDIWRVGNALEESAEIAQSSR
jgi:hypothetical protein